MLRRNLLSNYLGQGWTALMSVAFIPLYIHYLGIEAYGLIGFFVMLTAWLSLLDMGMTPTLSREMARFTGGDHTAQSIRDLLRTIEWIVFGLATFVASGVAIGAGWIANSWLQIDVLSVEVAAQAFSIMGLVIALRLIEGIYRSSIVGLQRQVLFNAINSGLATVRGLGAVAILALISPSIYAFFIWQLIVSIITLSALAAVTYATLPRTERNARFSLTALLRVRGFAGGMIGIAFLALLLKQVDKILLTKLLSLSDYGYYTLAAIVASGLFLLISPITQALYPRFCELSAQSDSAALTEIYHKGAQLVSVFAGSAAILVILFSETFLMLWTQDHDLAARTATLLSLLMLGNLLNGLMWVPYQLQLALGWTSLIVRMNIVAVALIVPAILWVTPRHGPEGAAWVWVILNAGYLLIGGHFMYLRILRKEKIRWYFRDVLLPLGAGVASAFLVKSTWPIGGASFITEFLQLALAASLTIGAALLAAGQVRQLLVVEIKRNWIRWTNAHEH